MVGQSYSELGRLLRTAARLLLELEIADSIGEAQRLWEGVSGVPRHRILADLAPAPKPDQVREFERRLQRRLQGEPLAYIEGQQEFYGLNFEVNPSVLIPRVDSETLIDAALKDYADSVQGNPKVLDLGTGSGCLLLTLLHFLPAAHGMGLDSSLQALKIARRNAEVLKLSDRTRLVLSDWWSALHEEARFDLILSNPPYVVPGELLGAGVAEFEPHQALFTPAAKPMDAYEQIVARAYRQLTDAGWLLLEVGAGRDREVHEICRVHGFTEIHTHADLGGIRRVVAARRFNKL